jgi:hypothetical protein
LPKFSSVFLWQFIGEFTVSTPYAQLKKELVIFPLCRETLPAHLAARYLLPQIPFCGPFDAFLAAFPNFL